MPSANLTGPRPHQPGVGRGAVDRGVQCSPWWQYPEPRASTADFPLGGIESRSSGAPTASVAAAAASPAASAAAPAASRQRRHRLRRPGDHSILARLQRRSQHQPPGWLHRLHLAQQPRPRRQRGWRQRPLRRRLLRPWRLRSLFSGLRGGAPARPARQRPLVRACS